jgi:hypothetical protein
MYSQLNVAADTIRDASRLSSGKQRTPGNLCGSPQKNQKTLVQIH